MRSLYLLLLLATVALAFPQYNPGEDILQDDLDDELQADIEDELQAAYDDGSLVRKKRLTCDLFSFQSQWVTPNHSACALRCLGEIWKYKGGRCQGTTCVCTPRG